MIQVLVVVGLAGKTGAGPADKKKAASWSGGHGQHGPGSHTNPGFGNDTFV